MKSRSTSRRDSPHNAVLWAGVVAVAAGVVTGLWAAFIPGQPLLAGVVVAGVVGLVCALQSLGSSRVFGESGVGGPDLLVQTRQLMEELSAIVLETESAARKLAAQVGETLSSTARIGSQIATGDQRTTAMRDQIDNGAAAIEQIVATIGSFAKRVADQKELLEQSASAVEQMSASISRVAEVSSSRRDDATHLRERTVEGNRTVSTTEQAMHDVSQSVDDVNAMITVIDDVAARTNLLAMNAAIEAAHAGASGRGFAVVAQEIRKLAENTADNASGISTRLSELVDRINEARRASADTKRAFDEIETGVDAVANSFEEITGSTSELATGAQEVVEATESLRDVSREISESADEMNYSAQEIVSLIDESKDGARMTNETMSVIAGEARNVTNVANRVSELSVENNSTIVRLIERIDAEESRTELGRGEETQQALKRLEISRVILSHLTWVGTARAILDGTSTTDPATHSDHAASELGQWLLTEAKTTITDREVLKNLTTAQRSLHVTFGLISDCLTDDTGCTDVEERFADLLQISQQIVEMLTAAQTGSFVEWSPAFAVDVEEFDRHHQRLFELVESLYQAMSRGVTGNDLSSLFDELVSYTQYHFTSEERVFEHFAYPGCAEQQKQHQELVNGVEKLRRELLEGRPMVAVEVMEFLRDWLTNHIKGCDKAYAAFLRDKNVGEVLRESTLRGAAGRREKHDRDQPGTEYGE